MNPNILLACSGLLGEKVLLNLYKNRIICAVLTDKKSTNIIDFCSIKNINIFIGNPRNEECFNFVKKYKSCILFSVNYLFLFDKNLLNLFYYKFNIHGSLLPKYRGRTPHVWAIINNENKTGITIHDITIDCDSGDIYFQKEIPIKYSDTGGDILNKYFYHYPKIIEQFLLLLFDNKIDPKKQDDKLSTYYEKRNPEDGKINWNWQRERLYNWVRALAPPYPGAFCYYNNVKIVINKIAFSDFGYSNNIRNGTLLYINNDKFIIKTPNGCIEILDYKKENEIIFNIGEVFN
ncbi:MAG: hypothetical protein FWD28_00005 [Treponema sp.]|nr:hypothetical protein [Treponema sp.]